MIAIGINLFILSLPLLPEIEYKANSLNTNDGFIFKSKLAEEKNIPTSKLKTVNNQDLLQIPSISFASGILEGSDAKIINKGGAWRRPNSSTPVKGGNTVFVAHRYIPGYTNQSFYNLPKIKIGDKFSVFWEQKEYIYETFDIREVLPTATEVEANTKESIITLYTCTPLWTSDKRLVVRAKLIEQIEAII